MLSTLTLLGQAQAAAPTRADRKPQQQRRQITVVLNAIWRAPDAPDGFFGGGSTSVGNGSGRSGREQLELGRCPSMRRDQLGCLRFRGVTGSSSFAGGGLDESRCTLSWQASLQ